MLMAGNAAVEGGEHFQAVEEDVDAHSVGNDQRQRTYHGLAGIETGQALEHEQKQKQQGRAGTEGRGQEAGGHDGGEPIVATGQPGVQETGDGMDGKRPKDGHVYQVLNPLGRLHVVAFGFQSGPADDGVEDQIA